MTDPATDKTDADLAGQTEAGQPETGQPEEDPTEADLTDKGETMASATAAVAAETGEGVEDGMSTGMRILSVLAGMAVIIMLMYFVALTFRP